MWRTGIFCRNYDLSFDHYRVTYECFLVILKKLENDLDFTWGEWAIAIHGRYESPILFISFAYIYSCILQQFTLLCTDMKWVTLALNPPHSLNNYTDILLCTIGLSHIYSKNTYPINMKQPDSESY
jgi:hypothetical protein